MGKIFGDLTNSQLATPGGPTISSPDPSQVAHAMSQSAQPSMQDPTSGSFTAPPQGPQPTLSKPSFLQAANSGPGGTPNALSPGLTKGGKLLTILAAGAKGGLAGYGASQEGNPRQGYGHFGAGFEAGSQLPFIQAQQKQQLAAGAMQPQMAQAQLAGEQAKTAQTQEQTKQLSSIVQTPYGPMSPALAKSVFPAAINAGAKKDVANINATSRMDVETMKEKLADGTVQRVVPTQGDDGQMVMRAYNKYGKVVGDMEGALPPAAYLPKTSNTTEFKEMADGSIMALPKSTTSGVALPGGGGAAPRTGGGSGRGAGGARTVLPAGSGKNSLNMVTGSMPDGSQVAGTVDELNKAGAGGITKLPAAQQGQVSQARQLVSPGGLFALAKKDLAQFKPGELEALAPRWNEFMAGTVGSGDKRYVALRTHVNGLLATALMQAHVGNRGSSQMMEHFENLANAGKMDKETLTAALNAEQEYIQEKAMMPKKQGDVAAPAAMTAAPSGIPTFAEWKKSQTEH